LSAQALTDTIACSIAAREHSLVASLGGYSRALRWTVASHVLDFDDLHVPTTTHISTVCVPAALASGGTHAAYLTGAGVMARVGAALGWTHYSRGWHVTCMAGAPAAAAAAAHARGLDEGQIATAMTLAAMAVNGVQSSFGSDAKSLQVGFAVEAGLRATALAADGARANLHAFDEWLALLGGAPVRTSAEAPAIPGGLAVKLFPCCYALQRPIHTLLNVRVDPRAVLSVDLATPSASLQPLIDHLPVTGLEAKFSMEYAVATALLDGYPSLEHFTDVAVARPEARRIMELVRIHRDDTSASTLVEGTFSVDVRTTDGVDHRAAMDGAAAAGSAFAANAALLDRKVGACLAGTGLLAADISWTDAGRLLDEWVH